MDVNPNQSIENKHGLLMNFLSLENYMQVDFPDDSYIGLRAFATRLHGDHEKYKMIGDKINE